MDTQIAEAILQTFVATEILNRNPGTSWDKEDWSAMKHISTVNLRLTIDMIKDDIIDSVIVREHLQDYPQQVSTLLANTLHKEEIAVKPSDKPMDSLRDKLSHITAESFVGAVLTHGIIENEEVVMDADAWRVLTDARRAFQHVVLGCIASRYIDLTGVSTRSLLQFMEAVMASELSTNSELEEAINEAANSTKH